MFSSCIFDNHFQLLFLCFEPFMFCNKLIHLSLFFSFLRKKKWIVHLVIAIQISFYAAKRILNLVRKREREYASLIWIWIRRNRREKSSNIHTRTSQSREATHKQTYYIYHVRFKLYKQKHIAISQLFIDLLLFFFRFRIDSRLYSCIVAIETIIESNFLFYFLVSLSIQMFTRKKFISLFAA